MLGFLIKKRQRAFQKKSYSQCGEDLIVKYIFDALQIEKPTYFDVGAHHPFRLSNTMLFYESGSRGVNIEPDPDLFRPFPGARPRDINLNIGMGLEKGVLNFYTMTAPTLNTFSKEEAERCEKETSYRIKDVIKIEVDTYSNLIKKHLSGNPPDFLSMDVEGMDEELIKGIDYNLSAPKVICVETITFSEHGRGIKQISIIKFLENMGYLYYADTNINSIFVKKSIWER